jgi:hypothetical protein
LPDFQPAANLIFSEQGITGSRFGYG